MLLIPDPETAFVDPVLQVPTLSMICNVQDPVTRESYTRDPRHIAQKAEAYLQNTGIADISYWGPEAEFYIFDDVRYDQSAQAGYYYIDSVEGVWNTGLQEGPNLSFTGRMGTTLGDQWVPPERLRRGLFDHSRDQGSSPAGLPTTS